MKLYTCNACRYTFPAETLPDRCPDCGKATANVKVCIGGKNILRSVPAIRESTDTEVAEYERIKKEIEKRKRSIITRQGQKKHLGQEVQKIR